MPVPKRRTSKTKRDTRRSHHAWKGAAVSVCPQCLEPKLPHHVCPHCGTYKGKEIMELDEA